jgi:hypothetical protein
MTSIQNKYFKPSENKETLTGDYLEDLPIETREHTYSTGGVYTGEWKGGLRHG